MKVISSLLLLLGWCLLPGFSAAQPVAKRSVRVEVKMPEVKDSYTLYIRPDGRSAEVVLYEVDSVARFAVPELDLPAMNRLLNQKTELSEAAQDSLLHFQHQLDSARMKNTYLTKDSATVFKSTHPGFMGLVDRVFKASESELSDPEKRGVGADDAFAFFTLSDAAGKRYFFIRGIDEERYPLAAGLIRQALDIIAAHRKVMRRPN